MLAGGRFEPGDRVVVLRGTGVPAFGARGTIIGVLGDGLEVLMDHEFAGTQSRVVVVLVVKCWQTTCDN